MAEQRLQVATSMHDAKDKRVLVLDAVHNHVFAHSEAAVSGAEILLPRASDVWEAGKCVKTVGDRVDQTVGNLDTAAFPGNV